MRHLQQRPHARPRPLALALALVSAFGLLLAAPAAAQRLPSEGTFTQADRERARLHGSAPSPADLSGPCVVVPPDAADRADKLPFVDSDTAHYARGSVLVVLVFVDHLGGTWDLAERGEQGAKSHDARQYYYDYKPNEGFLFFDHENSPNYYYYDVSVPYDISDWGNFEEWMINDACGDIGFGDDDGDGSAVDELTIWLQGQLGGWDNVIAVFIPADYHFTPAQAGWQHAWVKVSPQMSWGTWAHEWGHTFGACDEGGGPAGCNNIDCNEICMSYYLIDQVPNGNCQTCNPGVDCIMRGYVNVPPCEYTDRNWAWVDADGNGNLDNTVGWDEDAQQTYTIWELFHGGWLIHTNTDWGMVANQKWESWSAIGVRSRDNSSYALSVYGENNRNHHLVSDFLSSGVRLVVGDFNHNNRGQDHVQLTNLGGQGQYVLSYEGGNAEVYPDGVERNYSWDDRNVVRTWDVPLYSGETIQFQLDIDTAGLDLDMALFKSDGEVYYAPRGAAIAEADSWGPGIGESFTIEVPGTDVYGLVVWSETEVDGNFSLKIGPTLAALPEADPFTSFLDLRLFSYAPYTNYWAVSAVRPGASTNVTLRLFSNSTFSDLLATSGAYPNVEFIAADYNPGFSTDYLRVSRVGGVNSHVTEWEQGPDLLVGWEDHDWQAGHVAKVWDAHLLAGQTYRAQQYGQLFNYIDAGIYLMDSSGGDRYIQRSGAATGSNDNTANAGEWFTFTPGAEDWYGLVMIANDDSDGPYQLGIGPYEVLAEQTPVVFADEVIWADLELNAGDWAAVGVRPEPGAVSAMWLWEDEDRFSASYVDGDAASDRVRFLALDGHHAAAGTYFARADRLSGLGEQAVSYDSAPADVALNDPEEIEVVSGSFAAGEVVQVYDLRVTIDPLTVAVTVIPLAGDLELGAAVFDSDGGPNVQSPDQAAAAADAPAPGSSVDLSFLADHGDIYGLVVTNRSGTAGDYTIQIRDADVTATPDALPAALALLPNVPNPFNPRTEIRFALPAETSVELDLFDLRGRRVRRLAGGVPFAAGEHAVTFDGLDDRGQALGSGVYLCRLSAGGEVLQRKVTLMK